MLTKMFKLLVNEASQKPLENKPIVMVNKTNLDL